MGKANFSKTVSVRECPKTSSARYGVRTDTEARTQGNIWSWTGGLWSNRKDNEHHSCIWRSRVYSHQQEIFPTIPNGWSRQENTKNFAAHSVRGESTTEATGQHELGGVQSSDGGQPHGAAQGPRRLPVLLSQSGNLQFTLKILHFMFKLCQVSNCEFWN